MTTRRVWLASAASAAVALLAGVGVGLYRWRPSTPSGDSGAPPAELLFGLSFADAAGLKHAMSSYRGKVMVLNFWATWCAPCVEEIPDFSAVQTAIGANTVQFLGIAIDNAENVAQFSAKIPASYPLLVAGHQGSELARLFGNKTGGLPFTVVLDKSGGIRASRLGRVHADDLRALLAPVLAKA